MRQTHRMRCRLCPKNPLPKRQSPQPLLPLRKLPSQVRIKQLNQLAIAPNSLLPFPTSPSRQLRKLQALPNRKKQALSKLRQVLKLPPQRKTSLLLPMRRPQRQRQRPKIPMLTMRLPIKNPLWNLPPMLNKKIPKRKMRKGWLNRKRKAVNSGMEMIVFMPGVQLSPGRPNFPD